MVLVTHKKLFTEPTCQISMTFLDKGTLQSYKMTLREFQIRPRPGQAESHHLKPKCIS